MEICNVETPALLVDIDIMEKNIKTLADFLKSTKTKLRAHFKVHKTPAIAWKQIRAGAVGVCCQRLDEAEVCAMAGIDDIMITHQIVEPKKIDRIIALTKHVNDLKVNVDNPIHVRLLSEAARRKNAKLGVILELDLRPHPECGIPPKKEAVALAKQISESPNLEFRGIQGYTGYLNCLDQKEGIEKKMLECEKVNNMVQNAKNMIEDAGINVEIVTGSGTGSYKFQYKAYTEIQCGSYVFMDWYYNKSAPEFDIALSLLTTVVNTRRDLNAVMTNLGRKSIALHRGQPKIKCKPTYEYTITAAEHGRITSSTSPVEFKLGEKIEIYTSYVDATVNLYDRIYCIRDGEIEIIWPILARGNSQ